MLLMKILFVTSYGHLPDVVGGLQTTLHELCLTLVERGAEPTVLCGSVATVNRDTLLSRSDALLGYSVVRMPDPKESLPAVAAALEPAAIVVLTGDSTSTMIVAALDTGIPVAVYIHNVEFREFGAILLPDPAICYFSNSEFTRRRLQTLFGLNSTVLLPLIRPENYRLQPTREKILFVNPSLLKGVETFFGVAEQMADYPFRVFESWNLASAWRRYCHSRVAELANVEWCSPTRDVMSLYGSARILLMPSVWEEAYGRSATEAQISGIPVIASRRGGLPEAIGRGGILLEPDSEVAVWIDAIQSLYNDTKFYEDLSVKALENSSRVELSADFIVATLLTALQNHILSVR
jgi:glycosyltransferase involved in cell wall biosynthesis